MRKRSDCNCAGIVSIDTSVRAALPNADAKQKSKTQASTVMQRRIEINECKTRLPKGKSMRRLSNLRYLVHMDVMQHLDNA